MKKFYEMIKEKFENENFYDISSYNFPSDISLDTPLNELKTFLPTYVLNILYFGISRSGFRFEKDKLSNVTLGMALQCNISDFIGMNGMTETYFSGFLDYFIPIGCYVIKNVDKSNYVSLSTDVSCIESLKHVKVDGVRTLGDLIQLDFKKCIRANVDDDNQPSSYYLISKVVHDLGYYMKDDFGFMITSFLLGNDSRTQSQEVNCDIEYDSSKVRRLTDIVNSFTQELKFGASDPKLGECQESIDRLREAWVVAGEVLKVYDTATKPMGLKKIPH